VRRFEILLLTAATLSTAASATPDRAAVNAALESVITSATIPGGPGCVAGVAKDGKLLAARATGLANMELKVPMRTDMVFDIGSTSKQFTALSAAILARRGKLDLDADIRTYLPDMHAFDPPIRVRHLIHHSSGLPDVYEPLSWQTGDPDGNNYPSDLTLRMARGIRSLAFEPGSQYAYSNIGYLLLAEIVEKVSGQTLRAFADANIFKPMGMANTAFKDDPRELVPNRASAYSLKPDGKTWEWRHSDFRVMGDGGVYSTLGDLAKWMGAEADPSKLDGGAELMKLVLTPATYTKTGASWRGQPLDYGFGVQMLDHKGRRLIGHAGSWAGYVTAPYVSPDSGIAVIAICNVRRAEVLNAVLDAAAELGRQPR
jgi:CubicO group peptidase (beta-lactamase class C family)